MKQTQVTVSNTLCVRACVLMCVCAAWSKRTTFGQVAAAKRHRQLLIYQLPDTICMGYRRTRNSVEVYESRIKDLSLCLLFRHLPPPPPPPTTLYIYLTLPLSRCLFPSISRLNMTHKILFWRNCIRFGFFFVLFSLLYINLYIKDFVF